MMREQEQQQQRREWETPRLILLGRGNPEERVLDKCGGHTLPGNEGKTPLPQNHGS